MGKGPGFHACNRAIQSKNSKLIKQRCHTPGCPTVPTVVEIAKKVCPNDQNVHGCTDQGLMHCGGSTHPRFQAFAKLVLQTAPEYAVSRLAYAHGALYYMRSEAYTRAVLQSTDVTVAIKCKAAMRLVAPMFNQWKVDLAKLGTAQEWPGRSKFEMLHETSPDSPPLPWEFRAYRKVIKFNETLLVFKEMLCSRPKQPTTRPSTEACCVEKRTKHLAAAPKHNSQSDCSRCSLDQVIKQL